jgi:hypothetical protein
MQLIRIYKIYELFTSQEYKKENLICKWTHMVSTSEIKIIEEVWIIDI